MAGLLQYALEVPKPARTMTQAPLTEADAMTRIQSLFPSLNDGQVNAIRTVQGPLQIIAGPGSGKTLVLVLRTLYLLLTGKAQPKEILVTNFTEKAAFELRD